MPLSEPHQQAETLPQNPHNDSWALAWQFARCELRHSVMRFRIFLAALMLGVAAIGAVGSVAESMRAGIADNARTLLGGDFELSSLHLAPDDELCDNDNKQSNCRLMNVLFCTRALFPDFNKSSK